jgi:hypothetical protein
MKKAAGVSSNGGVVLRQVPQTTALYQPAQPGRNENLFFLRWATDAPPATIPLEKTWAESGTPPDVGYFLFLDAPPAGAQAFEQVMRGSLPAPTASAFAWVVTGPPVSVLTLLKTRLSQSGAPCVDGDTQLNLSLPGQESVGFGDGSPILASYSGGLIDGFVVTYPPLAGAHPPTASGVSLPMTGDFVGCVRFAGLKGAGGGAGGVVKALFNVSIDPLNQLDTTRNEETFTGASYILTRDANGYHISRAS